MEQGLALQLARLENRLPLLNYQDLAGLLRLWKRSEEYGFLREAPPQALQQILRDLDRALWDGLKKAKGMPRFREKGKQDSFRYPQGFKLNGGRVFLPKVGWVSFHQSCEVLGGTQERYGIPARTVLVCVHPDRAEYSGDDA